MILGHIIGKITTREFSFRIEGEAKKFEYVQIYHPDAEWVLSQIIEIEKTKDESIAKCIVIGYKDKGKITPLRSPFEHGSEVLLAEDTIIEGIIENTGTAKKCWENYNAEQNIKDSKELSKLSNSKELRELVKGIK